MTILRTLWADPRFRRMLYAIGFAVATYVGALIAGANLPAP